MPRNRLPASVNPPDESQSEEHGDEEGQADGAAGNRHEDKSDEEAESEGDSSSVKTVPQVRGLNKDESDEDSGNTFPSPTASDFVIKQNLRPEMKKRPPDSDLKEVNKKKMSKKDNGFGDGTEDDDKGKKSEKSGGSQRLWSPEDELMILTGMLDYKEKTGVDPNSNLVAFYNYIKGSLNASVNQSQLKNKIRKLKDKYRANAHKEASGEAPVFVRSHEAEAYEHSRKLWGDQTMSRGPQLTKSKPKRENEFGIVQSELESVLALPVTQLEVGTKIVKGSSDKLISRAGKHAPKMMHLDATDLKTKYATISMPAMTDNFMVKKGLELIEKSKLDDLNEKWNKYQTDVAELYVKRLELEQEHIKLIGEALKGDFIDEGPEKTSLHAIFNDEDSDLTEDASSSEGYLSEDSSCADIAQIGIHETFPHGGDEGELAVQNKTMKLELAKQKNKLDRLIKKFSYEDEVSSDDMQPTNGDGSGVEFSVQFSSISTSSFKEEAVLDLKNTSKWKYFKTLVKSYLQSKQIKCFSRIAGTFSISAAKTAQDCDSAVGNNGRTNLPLCFSNHT